MMGDVTADIIDLDFYTMIDVAKKRLCGGRSITSLISYMGNSDRLTRWMYQSRVWPIGELFYQLTSETDMFVKDDETFDGFIKHRCRSSLEEVAWYSKKYIASIRSVAPFLLYTEYDNILVACIASHQGPAPCWNFRSLGLFKQHSQMIEYYFNQGYIIFDRDIISHTDQQLLTMFHKNNF